MANLTIGFGAWLVLVGLASYFGSPLVTGETGTSPTALIPAFAGIVVLVLGFLARIEGVVRAIAAHLAVLVAVTLAVMTAGSFGELSALFSGTLNPALTLAPLSKAVTGASSAFYVLAAIRSFIAARSARKEGASQPAPAGRALMPQRPKRDA